jgi:hypothetical protein
MRRAATIFLALIVGFGMTTPGSAAKPTAGSTSKSKSSASATSPKVHVKGYTKKNGTYVAPYDRAYPGSGKTSASPKSGSGSSGSSGSTGSASGSGSSSGSGVTRDSHGKIKRSAAAKDIFKRQHPCPSTGETSGPCPGYVIDHIVPLCASGPDATYNMQWQTLDQGKEKDRWEKKECRAFPKR